VTAPISLRLPAECWWFIQIMRSGPTAVPLPQDVRMALSRAPGIEVRTPIPQPLFVVEMTRPQIEALQHWLHGLLDDLSQDDQRWVTCLHCIGRVARAIRLAET
jgi:hypothetical protein